jgi:hypothetical protein
VVGAGVACAAGAGVGVVSVAAGWLPPHAAKRPIANNAVINSINLFIFVYSSHKTCYNYYYSGMLNKNKCNISTNACIISW